METKKERTRFTISIKKGDRKRVQKALHYAKEELSVLLDSDISIIGESQAAIHILKDYERRKQQEQNAGQAKR